MATVLVALAVTELSPSQMSVGNVMSVPPPATELITPARKAAPNAAAAWIQSSAGKIPAYAGMAIMVTSVAGVYISYPFCAQKCTYCNFASGVFPRELEGRYLDVLLAESRATEWGWTPE